MKNIKSSSLVSVIIPVYNVEKYIAECLDSVVAQTYSNLEIILINDCSTDSSAEIVDQYAARDSRIRVIHKTHNEGLYSARLSGFDVMTGEYFTTIDSDDFIENDYISTLTSRAIEGGFDIVGIRGFTYYYANKKSARIDTPLDYIDIKNYSDYLSLIGRGVSGWEVCGKLFARNIFINAREQLCKYKQGLNMGEDILTFSILRYYAKSQSVINEYGYFYRQSGESSMTTSDAERMLSNLGDITNALRAVIDFTQSVNLYEVNKKNLDLFVKWQVAAISNRITGSNDKIAALQRQISEITSELEAKNVELSSYLGIKRSVRLAMGNIKRRVKDRKHQ